MTEVLRRYRGLLFAIGWISVFGQAMPGLCQNIRSCAFTTSRTSTSARRADTDTGEKLFVPVVFHIVFNEQEQSITDEQVYSQLAVLNEDFSRKNADSVNTLAVFRAVAASTNIQFYLADIEGKPAITRTKTSHEPFGNDDLHFTARGGRDAWNPATHLNIWIAHLAAGVFGYASTPGGLSFKDGVALHYNYVGRNGSAIPPFHLGRTLTHEVGHWLGLDHPWGEGGCQGDDGLSDTPAQQGPSAGCDLDLVSCGERSMVQNFMGSSDDGCMNLFTRDQRAKMRSTLITERPASFTREFLITAIELQKEDEAIIYPNPVTDPRWVHVETSKAPVTQIQLTDILGRVVTCRIRQVSERKFQVHLEGLANGIYLVRIQTEERLHLVKLYFNSN